MKYIPSSVHTVIGDDMYHNMITDNNKFLMAGVSIPIKGIDDATLDTLMSLTVGKTRQKKILPSTNYSYAPHGVHKWRKLRPWERLLW